MTARFTHLPRFFLQISAFFLLAATGCSWNAPRSFQPTAAEAHLVDLMTQRLHLARKVAWVKYLNSAPIYDPQRETELMAELLRNGAVLGLPATTVHTFFDAQIRASRQYQAHLIRKWIRGGVLPSLPFLDLKYDVRPQMSTISNDMLHTIAEIRQSASTPAHASAFAAYARAILRTQHIQWLEADAAVAPLRKLSL